MLHLFRKSDYALVVSDFKFFIRIFPYPRSLPNGFEGNDTGREGCQLV